MDVVCQHRSDANRPEIECDVVMVRRDIVRVRSENDLEIGISVGMAIQTVLYFPIATPGVHVLGRNFRGSQHHKRVGDEDLSGVMAVTNK